MTQETEKTDFTSTELPSTGYDASNPTWGQLLNKAFSQLDNNTVPSGLWKDRPSNVANDEKYYAVDHMTLYRATSNGWKAAGGMGTGENPLPEQNVDKLHFPTLSSPPDDSEIPSGMTAVYFLESNGDLYKKPKGSSQKKVSDDSATKNSQTVTTFSESNITLSHTNTEVNAGNNLQLGSTEELGSKTTRTSDSSSSGASWAAVKFNPNDALDGIQMSAANYASGNVSQMAVRDTNGNIIQSKSTTNDTDKVMTSLTSGTTYLASISTGGNSGYGGSTSNFTGTDVDIIGGYKSGGFSYTDRYYNTLSITGIRIVGATSGNTIITWDSLPSTLTRWDFVEWSEIEDNETVMFDILDSSGNVIYKDIPQNFNISPISASENIKVRVRIERGSTSNNPEATELVRNYDE